MENLRVGQNISEARNKRGMSTQQLAEIIDKSQATVSRIENGKQGVTLPLLVRISEALKTHPFTLLGFKLYGEFFDNQQGILLQNILHNGRLRSKISLENAAKQCSFDTAYLQKVEEGKILPTAEEVSELCILYSLDEHLTQEVLRAEKDYPALVTKLCTMNSLLNDCLEIIDNTQNKKVNLLREKIQACLSSCTSEEIKGQYFSIGHISDNLLKALQNPEFHLKAEELARQWNENKSDSLSNCKTQDRSSEKPGSELY